MFTNSGDTDMSRDTFTMSIEAPEGRSHMHPYHLGTIESIARTCAVDKFHAMTKCGQSVVTIALIRDGRIFDVYYGNGWHSELKAAHKHPRQFPSYTLRELEMTVLRYEAGHSTLSADLIERIRAEILARHSGVSVPRVTPQLGPVVISR